MIDITFLGTVSGIPTKDRNHSAIALEYQSENKDTLLFDCGEGTQKQLLIAGISFMDIDTIFITHWHADHFAGLIPLIQTMNLEKRQKELKIFGPEAERFVADIIDLGYFGLKFPVEAINVPYEGDQITKIFETADWEVYSTPTLHTVPSVAYMFKEKDKYNIEMSKIKKLGLKGGAWLKKLKSEGKAEHDGKTVNLEDVAKVAPGLSVVYTGDTKPCDNVVNISKGVNLLIHDGTFLEAEESGGKYHATVADAAEVAKKAKVEQLVLTHLSRRYTDTKELEKEAQKVFKKTKIAHDFMTVKLK